MKWFLLLVPFLSTIVGLWLYRLQDGRKEFFRLDFVQSFYLFLVTPSVFVWLKTFLFFIVRNEIGVGLSINELFVLDTLFSVLAFFVFTAIALHALTKTFWIKRKTNPKFDLMYLSEYFHLWWTHIVLWFGALLLLSFLSLVNVYFPLQTTAERWQLYLLMSLGVFAGCVFFFCVWISDAKTANFMSLMKLFIGGYFVLHLVVYLIVDISFDARYGVFWLIFSALWGAVFASYFFERSPKITLLRKIFLPIGWGENPFNDFWHSQPSRSKGRENKRNWINKILVLAKLSNSLSNKIRKIYFEKGLNV